MKRLLLTLLCLLFAYPCFAGEPIQLARMNPWVAGSVAASSCDPENSEVGDRTGYGLISTLPENYVTCALYEADCSGTFGVVYFQHGGTDADDVVKVAVFESVFQTDLTTSHVPDVDDVQVSGSQWVELSPGNGDGTWYNSGDTKIGGSAVAGRKYLVCAISNASAAGYRRSTSEGNYMYQRAGGTTSYTSPPTTGDGSGVSWSAYSPRKWGVYVEIE